MTMPCSPGMKACYPRCLHRAFVFEYRDARHAWEENRENDTHMQMEDDEYRNLYPPPLFKNWLIEKGKEHGKDNNQGSETREAYVDECVS